MKAARESGPPRAAVLRQGDSEMGFRFDRDTILVSLLTGKPIRKSMQLDSIRADFCGLEFRILFFVFVSIVPCTGTLEVLRPVLDSSHRGASA